jgi:hypothetical protein
MSVRTARRITRTRLFATAALCAATLSLTACESGTDNAGSDTTPTAATAPASSGGSAPQTTAGTAGKGATNASHETGGAGTSGAKGSSAGSAGSAAQGGSEDSGKPAQCTAGTTKIKATVVSRPINHLLLTATNTGSAACVLPPYPAARFGDAQSVPPVAESTKPQSLTVIEPGKSAYAGVLLSAGDGSADNGHTVHSLTVPFEDDSIATVALPSDGVYVDDSLTVTYWLTSMDQALEY